MQYRLREEEHATPSPPSKSRVHHRLESGPDPFRRNRRDGSDRSPAQQRNLSPLKVDGVRRVGSSGGGSSKGGGDGLEGRDNCDWHLSGRRSSRVRSRSPPAEQVRKRSHFDDGSGHRSGSPPPPPPPLGLRPRYELSKTMDYGVDDENLNLDAKRVYLNREDLIESRLGGGQSNLDQKFVMRENEVGGSYRSIPDIGVGVTSRYEEAGGHLPPPSRSVPAGRFEHERLQHRDHLPVDKIPITESHSGADKTVFHARDGSYSTVSPSYTKDFAGTSHLRDYGSSSMEMSRSDYICSRGDGVCLPTSYDLPRSSGKFAEGVGFSGHVQRPLIDSTRGPEIGQRNMMCHQQCEFSPARTEHVDYFNSRSQARAAQDEYSYRYDDIPRRVAPHGRLDYEQAVMEYDNRELSRHYISRPDLDRTGKSEDSYGNPRRGIIHDYPASQKPTYIDYHDMRRTPIASMQGDAYLRSGYNNLDIGERMPNDYEVSYMGAPDADRVSILRTEYESRRDEGLGLQQERFQSSPLSKHNSETYRQAVRVQEMNRDIGIHDHSDRHMKRKYNANDEIDVRDLRTMKSSKWDATEEFQDLYESGEWVDDEDMNMLYSSDNVGYNHKIYRKYKNEYIELENEEDFRPDEWISPQDSMGHTHRHSFRFQKYSSQNIRHHPKSTSSNWYKSQQHFSKRNAIQNQPKGWKKYHGYDENKHTTNDESYEDLVSAAESEPTEGSEEFKQMVHENFLSYSKKLNLNLYVQRRYQDHGKAGSLYCIVCGRRSVFFSIMLFY